MGNLFIALLPKKTRSHTQNLKDEEHNIDILLHD